MIIERVGEALQLLPQRAIWWAARRTLIVADVHFGKAAAYRAQGQPVPEGTTASNIERLDELVACHAADRLIVLGDFLHSADALSGVVFDALNRWRTRTRALHLTVIGGNHDRRAGTVPEQLEIECVDEPYRCGPFDLAHHPAKRPDQSTDANLAWRPDAARDFQRLRLCGHVHPAWRLVGRARESIRLPCFVFDADEAMLPAFGDFTGGHTVAPQPGRAVWVIGDGHVWPVPAIRAESVPSKAARRR